MDLTDFFRQWLYQGGHVILDGGWSYDASTREVVIDLAQTQTDGYPFTVTVEFGFWEEDADVPAIREMTLEGTAGTARFSVETEPARVTLDPRTVLLAEWRFNER